MIARPAMNLFCAVLAVAGLLAGCSSLWTKATQSLDIFEDPRAHAATAAPMIYQRGVRQLEQEDFSGAISSFNEMLQEQPTSAYTQVAIFNTGRGFEGLGRWVEAEEKYRDVVRNTARAPKLQALALYRLSFCHEARSDDPRTVAALTDVQARIQYLPEEVATAEMPARLAAAYARVGNYDEALKYYAQAEAGISRLRNQVGQRTMPEWLPRTLYFMGRMSLRQISVEDFEASLRPIERSQRYLLQATELETGKWSQEAAQEIIRVYTQIWTLVKDVPIKKSEDELMAEREAQQKQWDMIELVLANLRELRASRPPAEKDRSAKLDEIFEFVTGLEKKLISLMDRPLAGEGLTPEARRRREQIRGHVVRPDDRLEKEYIKKSSSKLPAKSAAKPKVVATPAPSDPNL